MKTIIRGSSKNTHISLLLIAGVIALLVGGALVLTPSEGTRLPDSSIHSVAMAEEVSPAETNGVNADSATAIHINSTLAKWTIMVYADADDNTLEEEALSDFLEMAGIGSNGDVNIVVQLDRTPGYASTYGDWTDCRRFLITNGLTPDAGNEIANLGEVNMGDPKTLVDFAKWAVSNYPAEKYALILSSHGKGWRGLCWDQTSGNDNIDMKELKSALAEITTSNGRPLNLIGFDACLMGMTEVAYEIHNYAAVMVASENAEPSSGWPYDTILANVINNPDMNAAQLGTAIVDNYYEAHKPMSYTMAAIDLTRIDTVVQGLNELSLAMLPNTADSSAAIKSLANGLTTAIDDTVIYEKHGTKWADSHGLAIYFPATGAEFDSDYNAHRIALANDTGWDELLISYYTSADSSLIAGARSETLQYYCKDYIDLYSFCHNLAAAQ
jgi:hypothetical protein